MSKPWLNGVAVALGIPDIDTDTIIPIDYCVNRERPHFDEGLFRSWRYTPDNRLREDFVLNRKSSLGCKILITGPNFGCGSSREMAVWALKDFGFRVIIAPSFADIFFSNCFKNGVLPIILDVTQVERLLKVQDSVELDLNSQKITFGNESIDFEIDSHRKVRLVEGLDDIDLTLKENSNIENFENNSKIISIF